MRILDLSRTWYTSWRRKVNDKHRSGWDSPVTGTDLLKSMLEAEKRKDHPLP